MRPVGDFGGDLNAAIDWPGGHDQDVIFGMSQPLAVHCVQRRIFVNAWEWSRLLPFELNAKQVQHVAAMNDLIKTVSDFETELFPAMTHQRWWTADDDVGTELAKPPQIAAGGATVGDVTNQSHRHSREYFLGIGGLVFPVRADAMLKDRQHVEQTLSGMLVGTVAGVEHTAFQFAGQQVRRARSGVPSDDPVDTHRFDGLRRVDEGFAFSNATAAAAEFHRVGAEPFGGQRETVSGSRAVLEEQVGTRFPGQQRDFATATFGHRLQLVRRA